MKAFIRKFVELGHHPNDPEDEKLKKSSLLVVSGPFAIAGLVWGVLYFSNGLVVPGAIPFCYGVLSVANIISFSFSKQYKFFRNSQLFLILILPFALQISLGGFVPSSAVIYWAIIAPAGAMFFDSIRNSVYWFAGYLLLVITAYLIDNILPAYVNWNLSADFIDALFLMNIFGVSCIVFGILYYFVGTITSLNQDIEEKNLALQKQSEKLKEMDKIKSRFFANISHEFRTPLTLILGISNTWLKDNSSSSEEHKGSRIVKRNAQHLLQLINQLLDLSKLESRELAIKAHKGDIVLFTKVLVDQFESLASGKDISVTFNEFEIAGQRNYQRVEIFFDHDLFNKVLINLLSNAVKFTNDGGKIAVEVKTGKNVANDDVAIVKISNTGEGIPEAKLQHIFDRFYQADSSSNRKYEGTGIGLALVKELVELHKGHVSVQSTLGVTSFEVQLPLNDDYLREHEKVSAEGPGVQNQWRIPEGDLFDSHERANDPDISSSAGSELVDVLIIEDNSDLRAFIKGILQYDYNVIEAIDGVDGFEKATTLIPDLIVSDVMMPRMDGYDLCEKVKSDEKTSHIPVILLTAKAAKENRLEGLKIGADDYLIKPFDEEELLIRIKNLISIREKLQQKYRQESGLRPKQIKVTSINQRFLEKLKEIIEKNIANDQFSVDDLGQAMTMSRSQLHRKLKALTNLPATTFVRNYRLHRAADLLSQQAGNITEVAYSVGFNSQTYFSSSFQQLFGCSPTEYTQRNI